MVEGQSGYRRDCMTPVWLYQQVYSLNPTGKRTMCTEGVMVVLYDASDIPHTVM